MEPLQINQPQLLQVLVKAPPFRRPKGSLTAPAQMLNHPAADVPVYGSHRLAWIAKRKIVGPPPQLPIDLFYQVRQRYMVLLPPEHPSKRLPLRLQRLIRRGYVQVP